MAKILLSAFLIFLSMSTFAACRDGAIGSTQTGQTVSYAREGETITFNFTCGGGDCKCGVFHNEWDVWVAPQTPGNDVTITSMTPAPTGSDSTYRNGAQLGPTTMEVQNGMDGRYFASKYAGFDAGLSLSTPFVVNPDALGRPETIIKSISHLTKCNADDRMCFEYIENLTVLDTPPGDVFRPSFFGTDKTMYAASLFDETILSNVAVTTNTISWDTAYAAVQSFHFHNAFSGHQQRQGYGSDINTGGATGGYDGKTAVKLIPALVKLTQVATGGDVATKTLTAKAFAQLGIDLYSIHVEGGATDEVYDNTTVPCGAWVAVGGYGPGRLAPILFANQLLGDLGWDEAISSIMSTQNGRNCFAETGFIHPPDGSGKNVTLFGNILGDAGLYSYFAGSNCNILATNRAQDGGYPGCDSPPAYMKGATHGSWFGSAMAIWLTPYVFDNFPANGVFWLEYMDDRKVLGEGVGFPFGSYGDPNSYDITGFTPAYIEGIYDDSWDDYKDCTDPADGSYPCTGMTLSAPAAPAPDLIVISPSVDDSSLSLLQTYTLTATVRNQGDDTADATTLRYYQSTDSTITTSDTPLGTDSVVSLATLTNSVEDIELTGPSSEGTYYVGACVDTVSGETITNNQCSTGVQIVVTSTAPASAPIQMTGVTFTEADINLAAHPTIDATAALCSTTTKPCGKRCISIEKGCSTKVTLDPARWIAGVIPPNKDFGQHGTSNGSGVITHTKALTVDYVCPTTRVDTSAFNCSTELRHFEIRVNNGEILHSRNLARRKLYADSGATLEVRAIGKDGTVGAWSSSASGGDPDPDPDPPAQSLERNGITWNFSQVEDVGTFANGDPWVVEATPGAGVEIISIYPLDATSGRNGSMINPITTNAGPQAFDDRYHEVGNPHIPYDIDLDITEDMPYTVPAGSSVVSSISVVSIDPTKHVTPYERLEVLTVLASAPAAGSFRPPWSGTDKSIIANISDINYGALASEVPPNSGINTPDIAVVETYFAHPWFEGSRTWGGRESHPEANFPLGVYGRELARSSMEAGLLLNLDYTNEEKETLLIGVIQAGIDIYGIIQIFDHLVSNGGHMMGRKLPLIMAAKVLNHAGMLEWSDGSQHLAFQEDQQTFIVTQADVDLSRSGTPYLSGDIGMPEWGFRHSEFPNQDINAWSAPYRGMNGARGVGAKTVAIMMDMQADWGYDAFFDYSDRFFAEGEDPDLYEFIVEMYNAYGN